MRLVSALGPYWHTRGHSREAQAWFDRALSEGQTAPDELRASVLWASAYQAIYTKDVEFGIGRAEAALELAERVGDLRTVARCMDSLASLQQYSDPAGAQPTLLEAAALAEAQGDIWNQIDCLQKAAYSDYYRDRWPEAIDGSIEVERLASSIGSRLFLSYNDLLYGTAAWRQGHWEEAKRRLREALDVALQARRTDDDRLSRNAAVLDRDPESKPRGRAGRPRRGAGRAGREARRLDGRRPAGVPSRRSRSSMEEIPRRPRQSSSVVCEGLLNGGVLFPTSMFMSLLALAQMASGDHREAQHTIDRLRGIADDLQSASATADADRAAALLARREGRPDLAGPLARSALTGYLGLGLRVSATETLELIGGTLVDLGNAARRGSGCSPRRPSSRRTTTGDRRGAAPR